jgi:uncharacterized protein YggE
MLMKRCDIAAKARLFALALTLSGPFGGAAMAQAVETPPLQERLLAVVGEGIVRGLPDMAAITLGVVSDAASAREALSANTASMTRIIEALKVEGIDARDLQTSNFSVEPRYSQPPRNWNGTDPFEPKIVGYTVRNQLTLRIRQLDRVGALLDKVITLGANSISGPTFSVTAASELEDQARRAAMREAIRKGEALREGGRGRARADRADRGERNAVAPAGADGRHGSAGIRYRRRRARRGRGTHVPGASLRFVAPCGLREAGKKPGIGRHVSDSSPRPNRSGGVRPGWRAVQSACSPGPAPFAGRRIPRPARVAWPASRWARPVRRRCAARVLPRAEAPGAAGRRGSPRAPPLLFGARRAAAGRRGARQRGAPMRPGG